MINICLNYKTGQIEIEGEKPIKVAFDNMELIIKTILNKAYYSGERLCLETKDVNGNYEEVERWQ